VPYDRQLTPDGLYDVELVDLATLGREIVLADVPAQNSVVANGDWVVQLDEQENLIRALDRNTGTESTYGAIRSGNPRDVYLRGVFGDWLLVAQWPVHICNLDCEEYYLLDVRTGQEVFVTSSADAFAVASDGGHLAFTNCRPSGVEALSLEWTFNLELFDVATGESKVIAPGRRVSGAFNFFFRDGQLLWQEYKAGGFKSRIRAYDLVTGRTSTLFDDLGAGDEDAFLADLDEEHLLIERTYGSMLTGGKHRVLELWTFDRQVTHVTEFVETFANPDRFWFMTWLLDDYALWTDPVTGLFTIFDINTRAVRQFDPFER